MKKILFAVCVALVAVGVMKFALGDGVEKMTYEEFKNAVVDNSASPEELKKLFSDLSPEEVEDFIKNKENMQAILDSLDVLVNDKNLKNLLIEQINQSENGKKFIEEYENIKLKKINPSEDDSVEMFAMACKAISEEE